MINLCFLLFSGNCMVNQKRSTCSLIKKLAVYIHKKIITKWCVPRHVQTLKTCPLSQRPVEETRAPQPTTLGLVTEARSQQFLPDETWKLQERMPPESWPKRWPGRWWWDDFDDVIVGKLIFAYMLFWHILAHLCVCVLFCSVFPCVCFFPGRWW